MLSKEFGDKPKQHGTHDELDESEFSLSNLVRPESDPVRTLVQWILHAVTVWAAFAPRPWLFVLGSVIFLLQWRGARVRHAISTKFFRTIPTLTPEDAPRSLPNAGFVTIIAPARDEEDAVETAVRSLNAQCYEEFEILAINDHSSDETGSILNRLENELEHLSVLHDPPPTPGWIGKPNAIRFALKHLNPKTDWLLFVDADVVMHPSALSAALQRAQENGADLLTCQPRLETDSILEKLLLPAIWRAIVSSIPYYKLNDEDATPVGIGAFILVRKQAYEKCGGHARFPSSHAEDTLLAGSVRESRGKVDLALAPKLMSIRLYRGAKQVFRTSVVKARTYSGDRLVYQLSSISAYCLPSALPAPLAAFVAWSTIRAGTFDIWASAYVVTSLLVYVKLARNYAGIETVTDVQPWTGWLHPLAGWSRLIIFATAAVQILLGKPRYWRGREETGDHALIK